MRRASIGLVATFLVTLLCVPFLMPGGVQAVGPQCSDGIDNDGDTFTDYPSDSDCSSLNDNRELFENIQLSATLTDHLTTAERGQLLFYDLEVKNTGADPYVGPLTVTLTSLAFFPEVPTGAQQTDTHTLLWPSVTINPGATFTAAFRGQVIDRVPQNGSVGAVVNVGVISVKDTTTVNATGGQALPLSVTITDHKTTVDQGTIVTYDVNVTNRSPSIIPAVDLAVSLPTAVNFQGASNDGSYAAGTVTWPVFSLASFGTRHVTITARVIPTTPTGTTLQTRATANGVSGSDTTTVNGTPIAPTPVPVPFVPGRVIPRANGRMVTSTSDVSEIMPGGTVRVTVTVKNTMNVPVKNLTLSTAYDPIYLKVIDNSRLYSVVERGRLSGVLPPLDPGQSVQALITFKAPDGVDDPPVPIVSVIEGLDAEAASAVQRTSVVVVNVLGALPVTGGPIDLFVALLAGFPAAAGAFLVRKRALA